MTSRPSASARSSARTSPPSTRRCPQPDRASEPACLRAALRRTRHRREDRRAARALRPPEAPEREVRPPLVGRADARLPREGDAQRSAPAPAGRAHGVARSGDRARRADDHPRVRREARVRRALDLAQHGGGRRGVRSRAVPVARKGAARGRSEDAPEGARPEEPGGTVHPGRARAALARAGLTAMRASRIQAIVLRQLYLMRGSMSRVLPIVVWVAVDMLVWGFMTRWLDRLAPGFDFVPAVLGAVLLWDFFARVMHGVALAFFEDVWSRNFLNLFASPLTI